MHSQDRAILRERIISRIEGATGALLSMPYEQISTEDLLSISEALFYDEFPDGTPEHIIFAKSDEPIP